MYLSHDIHLIRQNSLSRHADRGGGCFRNALPNYRLAQKADQDISGPASNTATWIPTIAT
jgi:hypothetical protein